MLKRNKKFNRQMNKYLGIRRLRDSEKEKILYKITSLSRNKISSEYSREIEQKCIRVQEQ